jgi:hypothetical protein
VALRQRKLSERTWLGTSPPWPSRKRRRTPGLIPVSRRAGPAELFSFERGVPGWTGQTGPHDEAASCCRGIYTRLRTHTQRHTRTNTHGSPTLASRYLFIQPSIRQRGVMRPANQPAHSRHMTHIKWDIRAAFNLWRDEIRTRA